MSRTLEFFEHGRIPLGDGDRGLSRHELSALVRFNDRHDRRYFDVGHDHVRIKQFVGYVEVDDVAIEILPKADREAPAEARPWRQGLLEMLRVAGGMALERLPDSSQRLSRPTLIELIGRAFVGELGALFHEGLARGYRVVEENGVVYRGRLAVAEHVRANLARADRFYVRYQTFDHDIAINRVLLAALEALSWCALSAGLACEVDACMARFPAVELAGVDAGFVDRVHLGRATLRYAPALVYARMILASRGPQLRAGRDRVFALLFDMNLLWERYIAVLARRAAPPGLHVCAQESHGFWLPTGHAVRRVRPDLVLRDASGRAILVVDTKWKCPATGVPSDDDLKQMFVYNELLGCERAVVVYPRTSRSHHVGGPYAKGGHGCAQHHVGVLAGRSWSTAAIQQQLATLLAVTCADVRAVRIPDDDSP